MNSETSGNPYRIPINDALKSADEMLDLISPQTKTRSSRSVSSIEIIGERTSPLTRTNGTSADTLFYLVNYDDNQGFALLSADLRTKPIYAISDTGNLNIEDTVFNKGLAMFMENAREDAIISASGRGNGITDSLNIDSNRPVFPVDNYKKEILHEVSPKIKYYPSRWDQDSPYNKYCKYNGDPAPVGCIALAFTQMVSSKGKPSKFAGRNYDWNAITAADENSPLMDDLAYFLRQIGGSQYLGIDYKPLGSSSNIKKVHYTLQSLQIPSSEVLPYPGSLPDNEYPALVTGYKKEADDKGHAWIVDGNLSLKITSMMYEEGYAYYHYEHCVWGWGGTSNGYYSWSSSKGFGDHPLDHGPNDPDDYITLTGKYVRNLQYIYLK